MNAADLDDLAIGGSSPGAVRESQANLQPEGSKSVRLIVPTGSIVRGSTFLRSIPPKGWVEKFASGRHLSEARQGVSPNSETPRRPG
jgi:hypothetical protein